MIDSLKYSIYDYLCICVESIRIMWLRILCYGGYMWLRRLYTRPVFRATRPVCPPQASPSFHRRRQRQRLLQPKYVVVCVCSLDLFGANCLGVGFRMISMDFPKQQLGRAALCVEDLLSSICFLRSRTLQHNMRSLQQKNNIGSKPRNNC